MLLAAISCERHIASFTPLLVVSSSAASSVHPEEVVGPLRPWIREECVDVLDSLAAAASACDAMRALPPRGWKRLWLQKLSVTLQRSLSLNVLDGIGQHVSGRGQ